MTRRTNGRLAGLMFLLYIATGITQMALWNRATGGSGDASATLASIATHVSLVQVTVLLVLLQAVYAFVLGVTLYSLTRDQDHDLALLAMSFRVGEGVINAVSALRILALLSIATGLIGSDVGDPAVQNAVGGLLLKMGGLGTISAICFAVASTIFSYLFLRARSIPIALAWLGLVASAMWVVGLPLQLTGVLAGPATYVMWIPMAVFEVTFALWLIMKGVAVPVAR
jgi:hypothetical protein